MGDDSLNGTLPKSVTDVSSLDPRSNAAVFLQAASMVIIMLVAVVGNLLILAAIFQYPRFDRFQKTLDAY